MEGRRRDSPKPETLGARGPTVAFRMNSGPTLYDLSFGDLAVARRNSEMRNGHFEDENQIKGEFEFPEFSGPLSNIPD